MDHSLVAVISIGSSIHKQRSIELHKWVLKMTDGICYVIIEMFGKILQVIAYRMLIYLEIGHLKKSSYTMWGSDTLPGVPLI